MIIGRRMRQFLLSVMAALLVAVVFPSSDAVAAGGAVSDCKQFSGLTNRIASCVTDTITGAAATFFDPDYGFYPLVKLAVGATITLAVIVYGVMMAMGMVEKMGRDTLMLGVKVACVTFFCSNADYMYRYTTEMMDASAAAVVSFVPSSGNAVGANTDFSQMECLQKMVTSQAASTGRMVGPWIGIDCLLDSVIGIKTSEGIGTAPTPGTEEWWKSNLSDSNKTVSRGMGYFFFSTMQTSVVGFILAVIGFMFIYALVILIVQTLFAYLAGYIGVAFMIIISPLMIPLVLWRQTKEQYFDKWVKLLIAFAMQPVIMLAFVSFSVAALDLAVFTGESSVMYRMAGDASRAPAFDFNKYLVDNQIITKKPSTILQRTGNTDVPSQVLNVANNAVENVGGIASGLKKSDCTEEKMKADANIKAWCDRQVPLQIWHESIDWEKLAAVRIPSVWLESDGMYCTLGPGSSDELKAKCREQIANEVLAATFLCAIVAFVLNSMMKVVPNLIVDLLGDFSQTPNIFSAVGKAGTPGGSPLGKVGSDTMSRIGGLMGRR